LQANWTNIRCSKSGHRVRRSAEQSPPNRGLSRGQRLGPQDHLSAAETHVDSFAGIDKLIRRCQRSITVRETRFRVTQPDPDEKAIVVVTTLLDPEQTTKEIWQRCIVRGGTMNSI